MKQTVAKIVPWLAAAVAILHTVFGTAEVHHPLLGSQLPQELSLLLYVCWHMVTVLLIVSALVFFRAAHRPDRGEWFLAARIFGIIWALAGALFFGFSLIFADRTMLFILGQWTLLIPIGLAAAVVYSQSTTEIAGGNRRA